MSAQFTVITRPDCVYCTRAKELLASRNLPFVPIELTPDMRAFLVALGLKTVPQIWHGTEHVGGYQELREWLEAVG